MRAWKMSPPDWSHLADAVRAPYRLPGMVPEGYRVLFQGLLTWTGTTEESPAVSDDVIRATEIARGHHAAYVTREVLQEILEGLCSGGEPRTASRPEQDNPP